MKKQKLACFLVVVIVISLLPNFSMGASWNRINKVVTVMEKEKILWAEAPELIIELVDELEVGDLFYLKLSGAKWLDESYIGTLVGATAEAFLEIKQVGEKLQIKVQGARLERGRHIRIPMAIEMLEEKSFVEVISNNTTVTAGRYHIATAMSYKGYVKTEQVPTVAKQGEMATLWIEEPFSKAFSKAITQGEKAVIELQLYQSGFFFDKNISTPNLIGIKGFEGINGDEKAITFIDEQTIRVTLPDVSEAKYTGGFMLSGIQIVGERNETYQGKLFVRAKGDLIQEKHIEVMEIMDYTVALEANGQKVDAGTKQNVNFSIIEEVPDSLVKDRATSFTFGQGVYLETTVQNKVEVSINKERVLCEPIKQNGKVIGFELPYFKEGTSRYDFEVLVSVPQGIEGESELVVEGRALIKTLKTSVLAINSPFQIEVEPFQVFVGLKDQEGGAIEIQEMASGKLVQGEKIILAFEESGLKMTGLPEVKVTEGDLRLGTPSWQDGKLEIPVTRASHVASTISIDSFRLTADQTIADGIYKMKIGGGAFSELATTQNLDPIWEGTFFEVQEKDDDTEVVPPPVITPVKFTIGKNRYAVGSIQKEMDATPYITNGRTMLPIKYVADAIGINGGNILWNAQTKTVTIKKVQTIVLQIGSKIMRIDGKSYTMSAPPEIKSGRTFIPVAEVTRALNIETVWDNTAKTVIFYLYE